MSMQSEEGRDHHQNTRDDTASTQIAGTGGTGNAGAMRGSAADKGSEQSASRNDDLLAGDTNDQQADQPLRGSSQSGQTQNRTDSIGKRGGDAGGSQQSGQQASQQGAMPPSQTDDDQYDQGTVQREP